jgi:hypothetical protein
MGPEEEERLENLYRIIQATHTLRADLEESLEDLSSFGVATRGNDGSSAAPRLNREATHRNLQDASAALADLRQRIHDSLQEFEVAGDISTDYLSSQYIRERGSVIGPRPVMSTRLTQVLRCLLQQARVHNQESLFLSVTSTSCNQFFQV